MEDSGETIQWHAVYNRSILYCNKIWWWLSWQHEFGSVFKWCCALKNTYIPFMKELELKRVNGTLSPPTVHPFYDFLNDKCTRVLLLGLDGAPYYRCIEVQLSSKNKEAIADVLRELKIKSIKFNRMTDRWQNIEVLIKGKTFDTGYLNKSEFLDCATEAIIKVKSLLNRPLGYLYLKMRRNVLLNSSIVFLNLT